LPANGARWLVSNGALETLTSGYRHSADCAQN
jgi:hypothetical protein